MYVVTVEFELQPGKAGEFLPLMADNARESRTREPGCVQFDLCTDPGRPDVVFLYEVYLDRAAFDRHLATPHFSRFDRAVRALVARKTVRTYQRVEP